MTPLFVALLFSVAPVPGPRQVTMNGEATLTFRPDRVSAGFTVMASHRSEAGARAALEAKTGAFLKALIEAGVSPQDLVPNPMSLQPQYRRNEIVEWHAVRVITVSVTTLARADEAFTAAVRMGGTLNSNLMLHRVDHIALEDEVRTAAAKDARLRAENVLGALGARLGMPISVTDNTAAVQVMSVGAFVTPVDGKVVSGIENQVMTLTSRVTVTFDIEPAR